MKKKFRGMVLVVLVLVMVVMPLSSCSVAKKTIGEKVEEKIGEGLLEKYIEGVSGGKADLDIEEGKWPKDMPSDIPQINRGKVGSSSSITVSGTTQLSVLIQEIKEKDFNDYVKELIKAGFTEIMTSKNGEIITGSFTKGESFLSVTLDTSSDEMMLGYTGKE